MGGWGWALEAPRNTEDAQGLNSGKWPVAEAHILSPFSNQGCSSGGLLARSELTQDVKSVSVANLTPVPHLKLNLRLPPLRAFTAGGYAPLSIFNPCTHRTAKP